MARKVEEKLRKKGDSSSKNRGRGKDFKGGSRGGSSGRSTKQRKYGDSKWSEKSNETSHREGFSRGRGSKNGGRGRYGNSDRGSCLSNMK